MLEKQHGETTLETCVSEPVLVNVFPLIRSSTVLAGADQAVALLPCSSPLLNPSGRREIQSLVLPTAAVLQVCAVNAESWIEEDKKPHLCFLGTIL